MYTPPRANVSDEKKSSCLVSIIIPVYNVENYLPACLDSVINQTYHNIEILLVDDGSTDGSGIICDKYAAKDNRIRVLHQNNSGVAIARINAFNISTGSLIMFVDADDYIDVYTVEKMINVLLLYNVDMVTCQNYEVSNNQLTKAIIRPEPGLYDRVHIEELLKTIFLFDKRIGMAGITGYLCTRLIKRKFVMSALQAGFGMLHSEDQVGLFQLLNKINTMYVMKERLYYYVMRNGQATKAYNESYWDNFKIYFDRFKELDTNNYLSKQYPVRAFMMLKMLVKMEFENKHVSALQRIKNVKKHYSSPLFKMAMETDEGMMNTKDKLHYLLLKYKLIELYYVLIYINNYRKTL